ncbi:sedoheptulose 7-phosphate cyclase [Streptomyces coacervatus]|uniref:sedoheptulose 7-phosphate cyclase n=1 Tax=Streptomyces coacervatus TaxID=647381 RepID=UPI0023DC1175|nr:sedoheptulose 7-phosphate cyclase [Streptomyces coacervatus]MDF2272064.1 sedoheptulose 7-phosphate cyclase [Streptomyces coacervatus]
MQSVTRSLPAPHQRHAAADGLLRHGEDEPKWLVRAAKPVHYEVRMVDNLLDPSRYDLARAGTTERTDNRRFIVLDARLEPLYGAPLRTYLEAHQLHPHLCVLPVEEGSKTMDSVSHVVQELDRFGIARRHDPIIAIGGGVLLDIVGFAASLYRRSTPYVRIPTTLIGLVDAGVGVKTGVNFGSHKNRLGTYFAPALALLDKTFLATLDERHVRNGLAEILKIALIKDVRLFELLETHGTDLVESRMQSQPAEGDAGQEVLERAIHGMLEELQPNLWESDLQRLVDYGHTFSPTIEMQALPDLLHGEAVNIDMALTSVIARRRGLLTSEEQQRIGRVMRQLQLPQYHPVCDVESLAAALEDTIRHRDGLQHLPLPTGIGTACFVNDVTVSEISQAVAVLAAGGLDAE